MDSIFPCEHGEYHDGQVGPEGFPLFIMGVPLEAEEWCEDWLFHIVVRRRISANEIGHDLEEPNAGVGSNEDSQ